MNWLAVAGIILVIGADVVATAVWWPPYFAHGLLLFRSRVPLAPDAGEMPTPERLARELGEGMGGSLLFRRLSESEVAFREPLYEWRAFSYVPVMHGLARRDVFARVVVVDGAGRGLVGLLGLDFVFGHSGFVLLKRQSS